VKAYHRDRPCLWEIGIAQGVKVLHSQLLIMKFYNHVLCLVPFRQASMHGGTYMAANICIAQPVAASAYQSVQHVSSTDLTG